MKGRGGRKHKGRREREEEEGEEEDTWQVDQVSGREPPVVQEAAAILVSGPHPMT